MNKVRDEALRIDIDGGRPKYC